MLRAALLAVFLLCSGFTGCGPAPDPLPAEDICDSPVEPNAPFELEIGGPSDVFEAWGEGASTRTILGGQGSDMIAVRARLVGAAVPSCVRLTVRVMIRDAQAGARTGLVATYSDGPGRSTKPLYVQLFANSPGDGAEVAATVGNVTTTRVVTLDP